MPLKLYTIGSLTDRTSVLGPALRSMLPNAILFSKDPRTASSSTALTTQSIWPDRATACNVPLLYMCPTEPSSSSGGCQTSICRPIRVGRRWEAGMVTALGLSRGAYEKVR